MFEFIADNWYWLLGLCLLFGGLLGRFCATNQLDDELSRKMVERIESGRDYSAALERLVADSLLEVEEREGVPMYRLTPKGRRVADELAIPRFWPITTGKKPTVH